MKRRYEAFRVDLLANPGKYAKLIGTELIVADRNVYDRGVRYYKDKLESDEDVGTIVVVRHPSKELYAVLDGHHRYWAQKELGAKKIKCAVVQDFLGPLFFLTKEGLLQPTPLFTQHFRVPFEKAKKYLQQFLEEPKALEINREARTDQ